MAPARICSSRGFAKADEKQVNGSSNNAAARIYVLSASDVDAWSRHDGRRFNEGEWPYPLQAP
jgi:hypothetical protein